ncbi:transposase [Agromyces archimandritae]|uniref:Transposase n=1 Tax=Agromyces archimandritae TaxID=2781962 RepID=A0A975FL00_9MICO|nr:transposase [Agromyces archimandritae]QTX03852.1 transposase [Agromyces archimandritae]
MAAPTLESIARELYTTRPEAFVAARNARAAELAGDTGTKALAAEVRRLPRPGPAAWAVDLLAADDALGELLGLGAELRDAQSALDAAALARLGGERRELVAGLVRRAADLAETHGGVLRPAAADEVSQTLQAATTDAAAAAAVASGRLVRPLEAVGLEVALDGAIAGALPEPDASGGRRGPGGVPRATASTRGKPDDGTDDAAALRASRAAAARVREAERELRRAEARLARRRVALDELEEEQERLEARLAAVREESAAAGRTAAAAERERDRADDAVHAARGRLSGEGSPQ